MRKVILSILTVCVFWSANLDAKEKNHPKPPVEEEESEAEIDTSAILKDGFTIVDTNWGADGSKEAEIIAREIMPSIRSSLPWPAPGFAYLLKDLDGDGGPELLLFVHHWTLCSAGCEFRIYKFIDGKWDLLFLKNAVSVATKAATAKGDKPQVALIDLGPDLRGPTHTVIYELNGDHFELKTAPKKEENKKKP